LTTKSFSNDLLCIIAEMNGLLIMHDGRTKAAIIEFEVTLASKTFTIGSTW